MAKSIVSITEDMFAAASGKAPEASKVKRASAKATKAKEVAQEAVKETKRKAKALAEAIVAIEPEPEVKGPEFMGITLAEGSDVELFKDVMDLGVKAVGKIKGADKELLETYLNLGAFLNEIAKAVPKKADRGQLIEKLVPETADLDPALRSNCKWLYEEINNPDSDLLDVLGLVKEGDNRTKGAVLNDFKSQNPTVIRREYRKALQAKEEPKAPAEKTEGGDDVVEPEAVKPVYDMAQILSILRASLESQDDKEAVIETALETFRQLMMQESIGEQMSFLQSLE